jgi:hypothetical protein
MHRWRLPSRQEIARIGVLGDGAGEVLDPVADRLLAAVFQLLDHQCGVVFVDGFSGPVFQCPNYCGDLVVGSLTRDVRVP